LEELRQQRKISKGKKKIDIPGSGKPGSDKCQYEGELDKDKKAYGQGIAID